LQLIGNRTAAGFTGISTLDDPPMLHADQPIALLRNQLGRVRCEHQNARFETTSRIRFWAFSVNAASPTDSHPSIGRMSAWTLVQIENARRIIMPVE